MKGPKTIESRAHHTGRFFSGKGAMIGRAIRQAPPRFLSATTLVTSEGAAPEVSALNAFRHPVARYTMLQNVTDAEVSHLDLNLNVKRFELLIYVNVARLTARHIRNRVLLSLHSLEGAFENHLFQQLSIHFSIRSTHWGLTTLKPPAAHSAATCGTISVFCSGVLRYDMSPMTSAQSQPADRSTMAEAPIILCPQCGYDLHGLLARCCPECGLDVDAVKATGTLIPFAYRQQMGFWRAYWKTVAWVIFRRKQFAQSTSRPVDDRDARLFQNVTLLLASIPAAITVMVLLATSDLGILRESMSNVPRPIESLDVAWYPMMAVCVWVFFFILTWMPRYIFLSRRMSPELRRRAISLSCFAAAPFAWTFIPVILALVSILIGSASWYATGFGQTLFWLSTGLMGFTLFAQFISWIVCVSEVVEVSMKLQRRATVWRCLLIEFGAPASAFFVAFVILPAIYTLIAILIDSLR